MRAVHGSDWNLSGSDRRVLFVEIAAGDAWPILKRNQPAEASQKWIDDTTLCGHGETDWLTPRMEHVPIRLPFPEASGNTLYQKQVNMKTNSFGKKTAAGAPPAKL